MAVDMTYAAFIDFRIEELETEISGLGELIAIKESSGIEIKNIWETFSVQLEKLKFLKELWGQMFDGLYTGDVPATMNMSPLLEASIAKGG
jgi:hypothetical protein